MTKDIFYDSLNRFDKSERTPAGGITEINADVTLDAIGNIRWKKDVCPTGDDCYTYHATQKRAVTQAGSFSFGYDANGNMTSRNGSSISYTGYNLPTVINAGAGYSSTLSYGAFRNRYKQIAVTPSSTETTIYVAGLLEKVTQGASIEYRHLIHGGKGAAAIHTRVAGGASSTYYLHRDHLGSPELITDSAGNEVVRPSFGAYGERRDGTDWSGPPSTADLTDIANTSRRGFTGHEHLDSVGLIHMNGRVYEPVAGRFLGVDPILALGLSQDVNSYSYGWNNPLTVTDPSGFDEDRDMTVHQCIECYPDGAAVMANFWGFMDSMGWLDYREPTIEEKRSWVLFKPGEDVDVITQDPKWDGGGIAVHWRLAMRGATEGEQTRFPGAYSEAESRLLVADVAAWMRSHGLIDFEPDYIHEWAVGTEEGSFEESCPGDDPLCGRANERKIGSVGATTDVKNGAVTVYRAAVEDIEYWVEIGIRGPPKDSFDFNLDSLDVRERVIFVLGHENYHRLNRGRPEEAPEIEPWASAAGWDALQRYRKWKSALPKR